MSVSSDIRVFDGKVRERFRWLKHVRYHAGSGQVELMFSTSMRVDYQDYH